MRLRVLKRLDKQVKKFGGKVGFRRYMKAETDRDDIFGEAITKKYSEPIWVKALVTCNPDKDTLTKFGIDTNNIEIVARVSRKELMEQQLINPDGSLKITTDDLMVEGGKDYNIIKILPYTQITDYLMFAFVGYSGGR